MPHDRLMKLVAGRTSDGSLLHLIGQWLDASWWRKMAMSCDPESRIREIRPSGLMRIVVEVRH